MIVRRLVLATLTALCALGSTLALDAGSAAATVGQFGSEGTAAGQLKSPSAVAVDQATGAVYVADRNNARIDKFDAEGHFLLAWGWGVADPSTPTLQTCTTTCYRGLEGGGAGEVRSPEAVAVDNDPMSSSYGDVYVVETVGSNRVEKFSPTGQFLLMIGGEVNEATKGNLCLAGEACEAGSEGTAHGQFEFGNRPNAVAVTSSGAVLVGDLDRVQEFSSQGAYQSERSFPGAGYTRSLAVDSAGDLYTIGMNLNQETLGGVREYGPAGELLRTLDGEGEARALALDATGHLFVDDEHNREHRLLEYGGSGEQLASFDTGAPSGELGIAFGASAGVLYVVGSEAVRLVGPPPPGPSVLEGSETASEIQHTSAALGAKLNPEGKPTSYHFEYGTSAAYGTSVPLPAAGVGTGFEDHTVSVALSGLAVGTTYHYRVVASSSAGTQDGPDQTFTTLPALSIDSESVLDVASSSATLGGQINPLGTLTTYHFEYGTTTAYGTPVPVPDAAVGSGASDVIVGVHLQNLEPSTTYHFRIVASNALRPEAVDGEDETFTTQASASHVVLPDDRAWELVSPPDKHGAGLTGIEREGGVIQAAADGSAISYIATAPSEAGAQGSRAPEYAQLISRREAGAWATKDINTYTDSVLPAGLSVGHGMEYRLFSSDLSLGLVEPRSQTPLSAEASERAPYLRHNATCEASPTTCYQPMVSPADVASGVEFGGDPNAEEAGVEVSGATPDLSHVVVHANDEVSAALIPGSVPEALYEWEAGRLQLVSELPAVEGGTPVAAQLGSGYEGSVRHAISDDGSRIVWRAEASHHLYLRDMPAHETVRLDTVDSGAQGGSGEPIFQTASSDGRRVFFTDTAQLTVDSTASSSALDLYEFDVSSGKLTDLTAEPSIAEHAGVLGVVPGASEDGAYVYFVANGVLAPGASRGDCSDGQASETCSLYLRHGGITTLVATLSGADFPDWRSNEGTISQDLGEVTSRVSPDGRYLAFMSERSLTGYDNRDASSGEPDEEVFVYDAEAESVRCASCAPTGARPVGSLDSGTYPGPLYDRETIWPNRWLAASVPGWTKVDVSHALYQSRYLSDSGRLFFNSSDALVPQDTNGTEDVYEFEPAGVGTCEAPDPAYSERAGGCVGLVSSGDSAEESIFVDASEDGDDAFFLTAAGLTSQDYDGALDLYDARRCTSASPCLTPPPGTPPPCTTGDSCRPSPSPQPAIFGAPSSATFSGAGNVPAAHSSPAVKPKSLSRATKLKNALKVCGKKRVKRRRVTCERRARKRYANTSSRAKKAKANKSSSLRVGRLKEEVGR